MEPTEVSHERADVAATTFVCAARGTLRVARFDDATNRKDESNLLAATSQVEDVRAPLSLFHTQEHCP
jgi:hypothetical protein